MAASLAAPLALPSARAAAPGEELSITYLGWAGVKLEYGDNAVFIDPQLVFLDRPARKVATRPSPRTQRRGSPSSRICIPIISMPTRCARP